MGKTDNILFKIEAEIRINQVGGRTWPIKSGYRPGFNFSENSLTSGSINLLNIESLYPGEQAFVQISFFSDALLGSVMPGFEFKFFEGPIEIGSGIVLKVNGWT